MPNLVRFQHHALTVRFVLPTLFRGRCSDVYRKPVGVSEPQGPAEHVIVHMHVLSNRCITTVIEVIAQTSSSLLRASLD